MFQQKLKELRGNMSQSELAQKLEVTRGAVGMWESGDRLPNYATLIKISNFFNVSIDELLGNERFLNIQMPQNALIVPIEKKSTIQMLLDLPDFAFNLVKVYIEGVAATSKVL